MYKISGHLIFVKQIVQALVFLGNRTKHVNACRHFALRYNVQTLLLAYSKKVGEGCRQAMEQDSSIIRGYKKSALYCRALFVSDFCLDNTL
jgi:hypothetical protein